MVLSALVLSLVSCSDGASSPTAVAAPQPTPQPTPYLSTLLLGGTWTGTTIATGYSTENYSDSREDLACLEARLSLEQGLVRTVEASFAPDHSDFLRATIQVEPDWTLSGDFRDIARTSFYISPLFLRGGSSHRICEAHRSYSTMVWNAKLRLDLQGDASPPNRLTGELNIRYIPIWDGQQTGGYVEQTNSITLSR